MFKVTFWVLFLGGGILLAAQIIPMYNNNMKINNTFKGIATNLSEQSIANIEKRILNLFKVQGVDMNALPDAFLENLNITKANGKMQVGSEYQTTLWLLGMPVGADLDGEHNQSDVEPMDKLRLYASFDFYFSPYHETP